MICETLHLKDSFPVLGEEGRDPQLDIYLPRDVMEARLGRRRRAGLLIIPGGGYRNCSPREAEPIAMNFLPEGLDVFVLQYSTAPHRYPVQLQETAAAMELIRQHADEWNVDIDRMAIMGFSAGGHLAAHYVNRYDDPVVRAVIPESRGVRACVLAYPVISLNDGQEASFRNLLGHEELTQEDGKLVNCDAMVTPRTPATFLWATAEDQGVRILHSLDYAAALHRSGVPLELHIYPHGCHGLATVDWETNAPLDAGTMIAHEWIAEARRWLREVLAPQEQN